MAKKTGASASSAKNTKETASKKTTEATVTVEVKTPANNKKAVAPAKKTAVKKTAPKANVQSEQSPIEKLPTADRTMLEYVAHELSDFRKTDPTYSSITTTDISKAFGMNKKVAAETVASLTAAGFILQNEDAKSEFIVLNWASLPSVFGANAPDLSAFKGKPAKSTTTVAKDGAIEQKTKGKNKKAAAPKKHNPYGLFGVHGTNKELDGFKQGDPIVFEKDGKKLTGEYRHLHVNNHSPKGYVVIMYEGKVFERSPKSVQPVAKKAAAPAKKAVVKTAEVAKDKRTKLLA